MRLNTIKPAEGSNKSRLQRRGHGIEQGAQTLQVVVVERCVCLQEVPWGRRVADRPARAGVWRAAA